jgi:hypothetical protein
MASRNNRIRLQSVLRKKRETADLRLLAKRDHILREETLAQQLLNKIRDRADVLANRLDAARSRRDASNVAVFSHIDTTVRRAAEIAQAGGREKVCRHSQQSFSKEYRK